MYVSQQGNMSTLKGPEMTDTSDLIPILDANARLSPAERRELIERASAYLRSIVADNDRCLAMMDDPTLGSPEERSMTGRSSEQTQTLRRELEEAFARAYGQAGVREFTTLVSTALLRPPSV